MRVTSVSEQLLHERERLDALRAWRVLDTEAEASFDELTQLASRLCGTPIALVSLVDENRQWFKSRVGLDAEETPRDVAFCSHAILESSTMVVEDTQLDDRFANNPLVVGDPRIRFYAGAPLVDSCGHALGTLCVIDREPRKLNEEQMLALELLSHQVIRLMELRKANWELAENLERARCIADMLPICSHCHAVRKEGDSWERIDHYFQELAGAKFSHGVCPACMVEHYADFLNGLSPLK